MAAQLRITLHDHLFADEVNKGVPRASRSPEIFDALSPEGDLAGLRETFLRKAFQRRQEAALVALRQAGWADDDILTLDCGTVDKANVGPELTVRLTRYRDAMRARFPLAGDSAPAFVAWEGAPLRAAELPDYLGELRSRPHQHGVQRRALPRPEADPLPREGEGRRRSDDRRFS